MYARPIGNRDLRGIAVEMGRGYQGWGGGALHKMGFLLVPSFTEI